MEFIEPKKQLENKVDWRVSGHTKAIIKYYSEYTGYDENEVVDRFLKNLLDDKDFVGWAKSKRRNKRMSHQLRFEEKI
ncbi:hypothetical protein [Pseudalkalibacillus hwajinpoensis]|uniref:hypothetical protein n=1 Tax=Guptibacillus hwajinpoensis TaxID=208199 RepID=UPI001CD478C6|nr:hypothetical protein [Pseudalkalibacillus hwajinpoensis]MCA0990001.1 hypothetical protein [Pseudalkalibacillus hwajinpoensis]